MKIVFQTPLVRYDMAMFVGSCMGDTSDFKPYMPNEGDDTFWTVDSGNNWKIKFFPEEPCHLEIIHRYNANDGIAALAAWVVYLTSGKIL